MRQKLDESAVGSQLCILFTVAALNIGTLGSELCGRLTWKSQSDLGISPTNDRRL
jgi:hypothetical protein